MVHLLGSTICRTSGGPDLVKIPDPLVELDFGLSSMGSSNLCHDAESPWQQIKPTDR